MEGFANNFHYSNQIVFLILLCLFPTLSFSLDSLTPTQPLTPNQTLISPSQIFELGYFSSSDSRWYLGIWYKNIPQQTYAWVANRDIPLGNSSGIFRIGDDNGTIVLLDQSGNRVWISKFQTVASNPVVQLLDTGNLVVYEANEANPTNFIWQSFDYPTDTLLPGMTLGWNLDTGTERYISSWKSQNDPGTGDYAFKLEYHGFPEVYLWDRQDKIYRSGPWNGMRFSGVPEMQPADNVINFSFVTNAHQVYYSFSIPNKFLFSRLFVNSSGYLQRYAWVESSKTWNLFWYAPKDQCDEYRACGPFGVCDPNASPVCKCMTGFSPKNLQAWNLRDGSDGCVRNTRLECQTDKFLFVNGIKLPESTTSFVNSSMDINDCRNLCLKNCSCTAYANADIRNGGTGCVIWTGDLFDVRQYAEGGQDLYVRLAASEINNAGSQTGGDNHQIKIVGVVLGVGAAVLVASISICILWKRRTLHHLWAQKQVQTGLQGRSHEFLMSEVVISRKREFSSERNQDDLELPLFDFNTLAMATNKFSQQNKLGEGGFGIVYRGTLVEGQEIAVKRLSQKSTQGTEEFKNEVQLIVRLQHRNLVRLLGCCIEMDEKMLIYEYLENGSLDGILFDIAKRSLLNWPSRFNIICGIARGLLYLHQDSRFRIIHRDLKASNILLDGDLNPKISDFGMARIFGTDQTEANTKRVVGTYGYMSPEYAMDGLFSVKSDVFSFGVLVLEIISGKKNRGFYYENDELNLSGLAWTLWKEGKELELLDASIGDSCSSPSEVLRCIQIGLLCVQERAEDRPTMSTVVLMLSSETVNMPRPKNPGFSTGRNHVQTDSSSSKQDESYTVNQVTVTMVAGR